MTSYRVLWFLITRSWEGVEASPRWPGRADVVGVLSLEEALARILCLDLESSS
jgi:hypothetical protein